MSTFDCKLSSVGHNHVASLIAILKWPNEIALFMFHENIFLPQNNVHHSWKNRLQGEAICF